MDSKIISIKDIDKKLAYEGYLWLSDSTTPKVMENVAVDESLFTEGSNPFVIEGFLYDKLSRVSYSIKYVDGKTIVCKHSLTEDDFANNSTKQYYANRMGDRQLRFLDVWSPVRDSLCLDMEVLQPQAKVFIGFAAKKNNEQSNNR